MVEHTQAIRRQQPTYFVSVFVHGILNVAQQQEVILS